ncbi:MAG: hypothetical protein K6F64_09050 [Clostridia bacterium]|nr:hypothetical protein [Clostridia bacterium]
MKKTGKFIAVLLALVFVFASAMPAVIAFADDDPDAPITLADTSEDEPELNAFQKFLINILEKIGNFLGGGNSGDAPEFITWLIAFISGEKSTQLIMP